MTELMSIKETMSSLQIAEITGKQHAHVMRDIRNLITSITPQSTSGLGYFSKDYHRGDRTQYKFLSEKSQDAILDFAFGNPAVSEYLFEESTYVDSNGQNRPCYNLNKKACFLLATGYNVSLRAKIIDRWEELELRYRNGGFQIPQTLSEALMLAAEQTKQLEQAKAEKQLLEAKAQEQERVIMEQAPQVDYCQRVLSSESTYTVTQIAKEFGWGAETLNRKLKELGVQYKQNGQWLLKAKYQDKGYTSTITREYKDSQGRQRTSQQTVWRETGRRFIHTLFD